MAKTGVAAVVAAVSAAGAVSAWWLASPTGTERAAMQVPVASTPVVRTTLVATTELSGTLGYAESWTISSQLPGVLTWLPALGTVIRRAQRVLEVDGSAVYLFYGTRPAWRPFALGMTPGPDVRQLESNLSQLGFGPSMSVDDTFTRATADAIAAWQGATAQSVTRRVDLGRIVFTPSAVRVATDTASVGGLVQPGQPVLSATSLDPVVSLPIPVTETYLVHRADRVSLTLPSGATTTGLVVQVSRVATTAAAAGPPGPNSQEATVPALLRLDHPAAAAGLDQAPVTVTITDRRLVGVLAVPVTALVALASGGYAVWVDPPTAPRHLVAVTPGLFADTLVQVTASGLHVGDRVEIPRQ